MSDATRHRRANRPSSPEASRTPAAPACGLVHQRQASETGHQFTSVHLLDQSIPCRNNPLGVKGVGELGTIGATPAVVNAVADALARSGHPDSASRIQMPLTPARVWQALQ